MISTTTGVLKVIAFILICIGAVSFTGQLFEIPLQRFARPDYPATSEIIKQPFDLSQVILYIRKAAPLIVGLILIKLAPAIARRLATTLSWQIIASRLVLIVGALIAIFEVMNSVFNQLQMAAHYSRSVFQSELLFHGLRPLVDLIPLLILWFAAPRLLGTHPKD